jgi:hypothetical protein
MEDIYITDCNNQFVCKIYKPLFSKTYSVQLSPTGGYLNGYATLTKALEAAEKFIIQAQERRIQSAFKSSRRKLGLTKRVLASN